MNVVTFVTYNIQYGLGRDGRTDLARIVREIGAADVIALQEVETFNPRSGDVHQAEAIAALLPEHHFVYGPGADVDAAVRDGAGALLRRRRQFGNMLLSRFPILWSKNHLLPKVGTLGTASPQRAMLETCLDLGEKILRVVSVHFDHCNAQTRLPQVRSALRTLFEDHAVGGGVWTGPPKDEGWAAFGPSPTTRAVIVMGDLNLDASSEEYALLVGRPSRHYGRITHRAGFVDAYVAAGAEEGSGITCTDDTRIDHVMVWTPLRSGIRRCWIDEAAIGSDHQPVWLTFSPEVLPEPDRDG